MVIDSSALVAFLLREADAERFARAIAADSRRLISVFNWLETAIVIEAKNGEAGARELDLLLHRSQIEIVAMNPDQSDIARTAWRVYGKGNHPAGLNIGDCCAYALAQYSGEPLLFKGEDFSQTDIQSVF